MNLSTDKCDVQSQSQVIHPIRLRQEAQLLWVLPPQAQDEQPTFAPFVMPPLPMRHSDRCVSMAQTFYLRTDRCMSLLLMLNVRTQNWAVVIPSQRCAKDAACWNVNRKDFPDLPPEFLLAGSFQSRSALKHEELSDVPPPHDGIHMVLQVGEQYPTVWTMLRIGEACQIVRPNQVLFDETQETLDQIMHLLTLV
jgi:hypothetical protein